MDQETHNEMLNELHNLNLNLVELINVIKMRNNSSHEASISDNLERITELLDERLH